jgi:hypothetical protein
MLLPFNFSDLLKWIIFAEEYIPWSSSLYSFVYSPVTSSLLGPNNFPSTIFSNILSLCFCLHVSDHILHPYQTTGNIFLYILIFKFWIVNWKTKDSEPNFKKNSLTSDSH